MFRKLYNLYFQFPPQMPESVRNEQILYLSIVITQTQNLSLLFVSGYRRLHVKYINKRHDYITMHVPVYVTGHLFLKGRILIQANRKVKARLEMQKTNKD